MTRRAFRPMTSAAAGAAPVISKAEGLPCGAFGSIAVLISLFLPFPRSWGARGDDSPWQSKKLRRELRAVTLVARVLRGWSGREASKSPCRGVTWGLPAPGTALSKRREEYTR